MLDIVDSTKIHGVYTSKRFKVEQTRWQYRQKRVKETFFLSQLKRANIPPTDLVRFYVTCIRSTLLYACQLFHFSFLEYLSFLLKCIQKRALKIIIGFDTSYNNSLELASLNKLSEQSSELCDSFCRSILANSHSKLSMLLHHNTNPTTSLRNIRQFTIPFCKTDRFRNSHLSIPLLSVIIIYILIKDCTY